MRFKVDENLPIEVAEFLRSSAHEADTVADEHIIGALGTQTQPLVGQLWVVEPHRIRLRGSE